MYNVFLFSMVRLCLVSQENYFFFVILSVVSMIVTFLVCGSVFDGLSFFIDFLNCYGFIQFSSFFYLAGSLFHFNSETSVSLIGNIISSSEDLFLNIYSGSLVTIIFTGEVFILQYISIGPLIDPILWTFNSTFPDDYSKRERMTVFSYYYYVKLKPT